MRSVRPLSLLFSIVIHGTVINTPLAFAIAAGPAPSASAMGTPSASGAPAKETSPTLAPKTPAAPTTAALELALDKVSAGDLAGVKKYKNEKGDLNAQNASGVTLLMQAVATGQKKIVQYLLQQKVDLEIKNENGDTALMMAIGNDQDQLGVDLLNAGAKTDVVTVEDGSNLVFKAASVNAEKTLALLLKKAPAQVNAQNKKGESALHEAARFGSAKTVKALLKAGAKKDLKNNEGKTPADIAKSLNNSETEKLLK